MRRIAQALLLAWAGLLAACGGGGTAVAPEPAALGLRAPVPATLQSPLQQSQPQGGWVGLSGLRNVFGYILGDGSYYLLYTQVGDATKLEGFYQGRSRLDVQNFEAQDGRNHVFGQPALPLDISAYWEPGQVVAGWLKSADLDEARLHLYPQEPPVVPTLASIAGSYAAQTSFSAPGRFSISADGLLRGGGDASVCVLVGQLTPRAGETAFDVTLRFDGPGCVFPGQVFEGAAFVHPTVSTRVYIAAANGARSTGILLVGDASPR
jgi:hypothetical protein